jgi:hypothetical protein
LILRLQETPMENPVSNIIQHDFGFPRIVRPAGQEEDALYAMLVSLGATRIMAERLMRDYPKHRVPCQAIVDFASDGESDMRGAIAQIEEETVAPWRQWRGGAT